MSSNKEEENLEGSNLMKRALPTKEERRKINLAVGKALGSLRRESRLRLSIISKFQLSSFDSTVSDDEPQDALILGPKLGQGGFSSVYVVDDTTAVKILSTSTLEKKGRKLEIAAEDIVREAYFLHRLSHPNIISFKGEGGLEDIASYYILVERIYVGMKQTLRSFQPKEATLDNGHLGTRLVYATQIASALDYMHQRRIIYRDLKLDNLGLNQDDQVVLYDFGLAKELKHAPGEGGKYNLTGKTGSWPYMAPEVAKNFRYNLSADVFSFSMLLWELCKGEELTTLFPSQYEIVHKNERPPLLRVWPQDLEDLMREGWNWNPNNRPNFETIQERLAVLVEEAGSKQNVMEVIGEMSGVMAGIFRRNRGLSPKRERKGVSPKRERRGLSPKRGMSPLGPLRGLSPKRNGRLSPMRKRGLSPKQQ